MKDALSSLDLHFLVRELSALEESRLEKVFQGEGERRLDLAFQFQSKEKGKMLLRILLPSMLFLVNEKPSYPQMPGHFAIFLRKHVGNARVISVAQKGFDRIIEFGLENRNGRFSLLIELIPPGNILLLNSEGKIISLLVPKRMAARTLRGGAFYEPPPQQFNTRNADISAIVEKLRTSNKDAIVKSIAVDLGFGRDYAEEICRRINMEKSKGDCTAAELRRVASSANALFAEPLAPTKSGEEVFPIKMATHPDSVPFPSFSDAIASLVPETRDTLPPATDPVRKKNVKVLQQAALEAFLRSAEEDQRRGELIYERYHELDALLKQIFEDRKRMPWPEVKRKLKSPLVVELDESKGTVTVDL